MHPTLRVGDKGPDVTILQAALNQNGFPVNAVDGIFGPNTLAAVKAYQAAHSLVPDGIVGQLTWGQLAGVVPTPTPTPTPVPVPQPGNRPTPVYNTLAEIDAHLEKGTAAWYQAAYLIQQPDPGTESRIRNAAQTVLSHKNDLYVPFEQLRQIPWAMTGLIHSMECGNNIHGCLHNGQAIIGTSRKTTIVPIGRGPFNKYPTLAENWLDAAKDAVDIQSLWKVPNWTVGYMLKQMELFNGTGYLRYHHQENSPYLWACTTINDGTGKYVSDGVWDAGANANTQVGAAAILRQLELAGEFVVKYA